jgi:uracil-DNA glycosylase
MEPRYGAEPMLPKPVLAPAPRRSLAILLESVRACRACEPELPLGARPVLQAHQAAKILIVGQAPSARVHESGKPWSDASGERLRAWMGIDPATFYDPTRIAIIPMGFCYPGRAVTGDKPPRPECAKLWLERLLAELPERRITLLIGQYAQRHFLRARRRESLTATVRAFRDYAPAYFPIPHPSPRNQLWLTRHPWFEREVLPTFKAEIEAALGGRRGPEK